MSAREILRNDAKGLLEVMLSMRRFAADVTGIASIDESRCVVWYEDMSVETITTKHLFEVFSSDVWQRQILCIQAFVDAAADEEIAITIPDAVRPTDHPAANFLPPLIAALERGKRERVERLSCRVCRDPAGQWWLIHANFVKMAPAPHQPPSPPTLPAQSKGDVCLTENPRAFCMEVHPRASPAKMDILMVMDAGQPIAGCRRQIAQIALALAQSRLIVVALQDAGGESPVRPVTLEGLVRWAEMACNEFRIGKSRPMAICGFGIGASVCLKLSTLPSVSHLGCVVSVNGFAWVDKSLRSRLPKLCDLRRTEWPMEEFLSQPIDMLEELKELKAPLLMLQSTENQVVLPLHVEAMARCFRNSSVKRSIQACFKDEPQCCHIGWLRATHDVLHERTNYLSSFFSEVETALTPTLERPDQGRPRSPVVEEEVIRLNDQDIAGEELELNEAKRVSVFDASQMYINLPSPPVEDEKEPDGLPQQEEASSRPAVSPSTSSFSDAESLPPPTQAPKRPLKAVSIEVKPPPSAEEERLSMSSEDAASRNLRCRSKEAEQWEAQHAVSSSRVALLQQLREKESRREAGLLPAQASSKMYEEEGEEEGSEAGMGGGLAKLRLTFLSVARRQALAIARVAEVSEMVRHAVAQLADAERRKSQLERAKYMLQSKLRRCEKKRRRLELSRELETLQAEVEEAAAEVYDKGGKLNALRKELSKVDARVQTDCIILQRRAEELQQLLTQLESKLAEIEALSDRLDAELEELEGQQKAMARLLGKLVEREEELCNECERIGQLTTPYIDSALWQAGVMQRMRADDLRQYLLNELSSVRSRIETLTQRITDADKNNASMQGAIAKCLTDKASTASQLRLLRELLEAYSSGQLRNSSTSSAKAAVLQPAKTPKRSDLGAVARKKPEAKLSLEEKEWLALDAVSRGEPGDTSISSSRVKLLLSLPEEANLALPFFLSPEELRAYELLQKFSLGRERQAQETRDQAQGRERCKENLVIVEELTKEVVGRREQKMLLKQDAVQLYASTWQRLGSRQGRVHCFKVSSGEIFIALTATVVFEGEFRRDAFVCARLSAALFWGDTAVGYPVEVAVNTSEQLGRVVIRHAPGNHAVPLPEGEYRIVVATASVSRYSVEVRGRRAERVEQAVQSNLEDFRRMKLRRKEIEKEIQKVEESVYLAERKRFLVKQMQEEAEKRCVGIEIEISEVAAAVDEDPEMRRKEHQRLQLSLAKSIRLAASRRKEQDDVTSGAEELREIQRKMTHELNDIDRRQVFYKKLGLKLDAAQEDIEVKPAEEEAKEPEKLAEQEFSEACWTDVEQSIAAMRHPTEDQFLTRPELLALLSHGGECLKAKLLTHLLREKMPTLAGYLTAEVEPEKDAILGGDRADARDVDVDERCRQVLRELEKANACESGTMDSSLLHGAEQRFAVVTLRKELNRELDRLLTLQVVERERAALRSDPILEDNALLGDESSSSSSFSSSEESAQQEEETVVDRLYCRACRTSPCSWQSCVDLVAVKKRVILLENELNGVRLMDDAFVTCTVLDSNKTRYVRKDLLELLSEELRKVQRRERLALVDAELHDAYATTQPFIETKALHGFRQVQWTENVKIALDDERKRLEAEEVAQETLDGVLDWMLAGWYFGEVSTKGTGSNDLSASTSAENFKAKKGGQRGDLRDKWLRIAEQSRQAVARRRAVDEVHAVKTRLDETEHVLRFGLFLLTMMYFRAMNLLKKSRFPDASKIKAKNVAEINPTAHRAARVAQRTKAMQAAMAKAAAGERMKQERVLSKQKLERQRLREELEKIKLETASARAVQRIFRGFLGRRAAQKWTLLSVERKAHANLKFAAAALLQRVFRGYQARLIAEDKRLEMAEFIAKVRAREAREEEEEYWRRHPIKRAMRNLQIIRRKKKSNNAPDLLSQDSDVDSIGSLHEEAGV